MVKLQKRAARIITDSPWDAPSKPLFDALGITPFPERVKKSKAKLMFKALNNLAPDYVTSKFKKFKQVHNICTRNSNHNLVLPKVKSNFGKRTFSFSGAKLWNHLPTEMKLCTTLISFKNKVNNSKLTD